MNGRYDGRDSPSRGRACPDAPFELARRDYGAASNRVLRRKPHGTRGRGPPSPQGVAAAKGYKRNLRCHPGKCGGGFSKVRGPGGGTELLMMRQMRSVRSRVGVRLLSPHPCPLPWGEGEPFAG